MTFGHEFSKTIYIFSRNSFVHRCMFFVNYVKIFFKGEGHNERYGISNHWRFECLLFVKTQIKEKINVLCEGNPPGTGGFPQKGPETREMFPFDDVTINMGKGNHQLATNKTMREFFG